MITFNFDRLFEFALFEMLRHSFGEKWAVPLAEAVEVVHVHGMLGGRSWLPGEEAPRAFEPHLTERAVKAAEFRITTVGGQISPDTQKRAEHLIRSASRIAFLGFGYEHENVKWLWERGFSAFLGQRLSTGYHLLEGERRLAWELFKITDKCFGTSEQRILEFIRRRRMFFDSPLLA